VYTCLIFCLIATGISLVGLINNEAFADLSFGVYLVLSLLIFIIDIGTKKLTKNRKVYYWLLQTALLLALYLLTLWIVGGMFSSFA
jgi:hypothetical protein